ncbi:MAG: site-2 protease family protein [Candidatus Micrarchaeota archaeon]|nr:site-2 protease family protein [Candidatus Micrarchaeota archaeon]
MEKENRAIISAISLIVGLSIFYYLITLSTVSVVTRAVIAVIMLFVLSAILVQVNKFKHLFGAFLLGTKSGSKLIDDITKLNPRFWIALADWGTVMSFGILSYFIFRKQFGIKTLVVGIISLFVMIGIILPYSAIAFQFISIPQITQSASSAQAAPSTPLGMIASYIWLGVVFIGGFGLYVLLTILYAALGILYGLAIFLYSLISGAPNYTAISSQTPGVAPLIPGITIPLLAGLATLAILLIVHEFSHGILARVAKVKIKQIGLLVLGFIPIGAFVEPEMRHVKKLKPEKQIRILVGGIAANLLFSIIFFVLLILLVTYLLPNALTTKIIISAVVPNSPAFGIIPAGSQILQWNGHPIQNFSSFTNATSSQPFELTTLVTDKGSYSLTSNAAGKIGVDIAQLTGPKPNLASNIIYFFYTLFSLSFLLNFLVGALNLLPIPSFDGWQIYQLKVKNKKVLRYIAAIAVVSILILILPWFYAH